MALRPEGVEEKCTTEDGGHGYADEDVVGEYTDYVVVLDVCEGAVASLDAVLLVYIVWGVLVLMYWVTKRMKDWEGRVPDSAEVPTDSEIRQRIMAISGRLVSIFSRVIRV